MTTSDEIQRLAAEGMATADIARQLGIRYQFAYGVLGRRVPLPDRSAAAVKRIFEKPALQVERLTTAGFQLAAAWIAGDQGRVALSEKLPKVPGVYAFAINGIVQYVGLASMDTSSRFISPCRMTANGTACRLIIARGWNSGLFGRSAFLGICEARVEA